jgi:hypothetical protein
VHFLRCVHAEWILVRPRLVRTRYGALLLLLTLTLVSLHGRGLDPPGASLLGGALAAIIGVSFGVGSDRAAFTTALTHPISPLAIASGRWLAAFVPAVVVVLTCAAATERSVVAAGAGMTSAAAVAGCALAAVLAVGNGAAAALFLFMAIAGSMPPERLVAFAHPGVLRVAAASALELGPALWHYRDVARGDASAVLHGVAWAGLGILLASGVIARRRR